MQDGIEFLIFVVFFFSSSWKCSWNNAVEAFTCWQTLICIHTYFFFMLKLTGTFPTTRTYHTKKFYSEFSNDNEWFFLFYFRNLEQEKCIRKQSHELQFMKTFMKLIIVVSVEMERERKKNIIHSTIIHMSLFKTVFFLCYEMRFKVENWKIKRLLNWQNVNFHRVEFW